jgi:hypothetical protein
MSAEAAHTAAEDVVIGYLRFGHREAFHDGRQVE